MLGGTDIELRWTLTTRLPQEQKVKQEEDEKRRRMIVLSGPTGCGKTELSLMLAEELDGEIVSADSMQVYKGMDIGTAKATLEERSRVPHHMIDVREVTDPFNVVDFYYEAQTAIEKVISNDRVPIIVGGSGFYLRTLLYGPPAGPPSVPTLRAQLEEQMDEFGANYMYERLAERDPTYASSITPHDRQKIIRGLEIITLTGEPVSSNSWRSRPPNMEGYLRCWFLYRPREVLYKRVEERCDQMIEEGFIEEVERLVEMGIKENRTVAHSIGYRQCLEYLDSDRTEADFKHFLETFKTASRHYVKRQFTWFRREPLFRWLNADVHDPEVLVDMMAHDFRSG